MKVLICVMATLGLLTTCSDDQKESSRKSGESAKVIVETFYTCSMHPQVKEDKPGKCPICHMGLTKVVEEHDHASESVKIEDAEDEYYCESDPSVKSKAPGECPIDGTAMIKKSKSLKVVGKVKLRKSQVNHFKADIFTVTTMKMTKKIRLLGTLMKSEEKESNIPARVPGRVEQVFVQSTGSLIKAGDPVVKLYSPQLLTGGEEYLIALRNYRANPKSKDFRNLLRQSKERLKLWGVQDLQLESWSKTNKIPRVVTIYSPVTGIVENKNAVVGKYFREGQSFFDLVDLSSLWVELDVYEHDSALIGLGQGIEIEFSAYPGEIWRGKVDFVSPILNHKTRTLKIRTTLENTKGKLRPGMVGTASVTLNFPGLPLVVPKSAVIDTGKRKVLWLEVSKEVYEAQEIHTGFESEGFVEIKEGVKEGDGVVTSGSFLLDAQAQLFGGYHQGKENKEPENQGDHHAH